MRLLDRGLDLGTLESTEPEEIEAFREYYVRTKGYLLPGFQFWLDFRPDVLKRYRLQARNTPGPDRLKTPLSNTLAFVHWYTIVAYEKGVLYEIRNAETMGATRAEILETLSVAFLHAGPRGMDAAAALAHEYLRSYNDPVSSGLRFPSGWSTDPDAFRSGLDFTNPELTPAEADALRNWYMATEGEIPPFVNLLIEHKPNLLKAYRNRFEHAIRTLPKQMMPFLMLHFEVGRSNAAGIREAALLARAFGMTKDEAVDAIAWGMLYGGGAAASTAESAAGDVLRQWTR